MAKSLTLNKTIDEYRKNFYKLYHSTIVPIFVKYERERKSELLALIIFISISAFMAIISYQGMTRANADGSYGYINIVCFLLLVVSVIATIALPFYFYNKFLKNLKSECMQKLLKLFGDVNWFWNVHLIEDKELYNSELFSDYNMRTTDDSVMGSYKGVKFQISETKLQQETHNGRYRRVYTIFKGVVIKFDANKPVRNKTIVATKGDIYIGPTSAVYSLWAAVAYLALTMFSDISRGYSSEMIFFKAAFIVTIILGMFIANFINRGKKEVLNEIKLEDPEFSKKYKAYSSDQVEGRYLITPAFMERFKNIQTAFGTKKVKCSFYNDSLMFAISTNKNLFEIGNLFCSLENPRHFETFFNELTSIFMLVDYFKLDEKTGL